MLELIENPLIKNFTKRTNNFLEKEKYFVFLCLVSHVNLLTCNLLHLIRINFSYPKLDPIVVSDLHVSSFFQPIGSDIFKITQEVKDLVQPNVSIELRRELGQFLTCYVKKYKHTMTKNILDIYIENIKTLNG